MTETRVIQGRQLGPEELGQIRELMTRHPQWGRTKISRALARQWDWRNGAGQLKDMAARRLLCALDQRGWIHLPPRRHQPPNRMRIPIPHRSWDQTPIECPLQELGRLDLEEVSNQVQQRAAFAAALAQFHYLGYRGTVGENTQYTLSDCQGRLLACVLFGAAAWKCADRDHFIGWNAEQRQRQLSLLANNMRFLILPWVKVAHLGSWVLGRVTRRISADWQRKYGHKLVLLESFVQQDRFRGTVYQAANWLNVGATQGRTRQDRFSTIRAPIKDIYLYPLQENFREIAGT